ncbi:patatin-like phospholipase family protein [Corynebacterium cystitidis]|uniref:Predicted phospholipase, patatin/cPLA2 family n=1 Tax=Corynebacterium cystitidis DSM 20524 TaxID=1121357 RepID=A0A1H9TTC5_9CORY|nr:patatin family protein [Corynebacterium cystitidis]WJY81974.1 Patatin-like phospholipase [Corynebacterium cystitidis DSM 20524]SER99963.1 Predicted phospholipase, patatin/cPLA2 family [Corynebacterium cystitidis DSM 20524]SNV81360.1 phospholipase [Corynebacterium cystitidis]
MIDATDTALVLEGGGMRNSYTAACIVALIENDVRFGWVGGVSAGASHLSNYVSRDAHRAKASFTTFATHPEFGGWQSLFRGTGYFNAEFIYENSEQALPFDWDTFRSNPCEVHVDACRADNGETVSWTRANMAEREDVLAMVRASSTLPLMMPIRQIDEVPYVDGALGNSGGLLIDAAEQAGYEKFLVIASRPRSYWKPAVRRPEALRRLYRTYPAVAQAQITRPQRYNAAKRRILDLEQQGKAQVFFPDTMPVNVGERRVDKLEAAYQLGREQTQREWPAWIEFLAADRRR